MLETEISSPTLHRILIIDDEPDLCDIMSDELEFAGFSTFKYSTFKNKEQILEKINEVKPDGLVIDLNLGVTTGIEIAQLVRKENPVVAIIILTGDSTPELVAKAKDAGCNGVFQKPCNTEELDSQLRHLIYEAASHRLSQELS